MFFALLCGAPVLAQDIRFNSLATSQPRMGWFDVAVPRALAQNFPVQGSLQPMGWPAVRGVDIGDHSVMVHVRADRVEPHAMADAQLSALPPTTPVNNYTRSVWVAANPLDRMPEVHAFYGGRHRRLSVMTVATVESNEAREVFHYRGRLEGSPLAVDIWSYVYHRQEAVRTEIVVTASEPSWQDMSLELGGLWVESLDPFVLDYRTRLGMPQLSVNGGNTWAQLLSGPRVMGKAEQLVYTGWNVAIPGKTGAEFVQRAQQDPSGARVTTLQLQSILAQLQGPMNAVCKQWEGHWLGTGHIPPLPTSMRGDGGWADANRANSDFLALLQQPADQWERRPLGLLPHAANTGYQDDFGLTAGELLTTVADPRRIYELGYNVMGDFYRPFHHREANGEPLLRSTHPGFWSWSQLPHYSGSDMLGFPRYLWTWDRSGWSGQDDQHRSQNRWASYYAVTGSYMMRASLFDYLQMDLAQIMNRTGSGRAVGRLFIAWSNMLRLCTPAQKQELTAHARERVIYVLNNSKGSRFAGDPTRTVRVVDTVLDTRALTNQVGEAVPAWMPWQEAIASGGAYSMFKVTGDPLYRELSVFLAETILKHGVYQDVNGEWFVCYAARYRDGIDEEGLPLPPWLYYRGSPFINVGSSSWWNWTLPAVLAYAEIGPGSGPLHDKAVAIIAQEFGNGSPSWSHSRWWVF